MKMKKIHIILLSIIAFAVIGFFVLETQQAEIPHSSEVSKLLKDTSKKNNPKKQQQQAEKANLSPQINAAENNIQNMMKEIENEITSADSAAENQQAEEIIKRSDSLIAKINKQYSIDTSHINAIITPSAETIAALKSDDPEIQKIEQEQDNLKQNIQEFNQLLK